MRVLTVVGARPQFIKAGPVSVALRDAGHVEYMVHTGQHYDYGMSQIFFDELDISPPDVDLGVGSGPHGRQTGQMLAALEPVMQEQKPTWVLVYGDTNSTLAGAVCACKLRLPLAHVEAGLRSYNKEMPEEHNRVLSDHCADTLFCPTPLAVKNLATEGITHNVHLVGDTMYDAFSKFAKGGQRSSKLVQELEIESKGYVLATVHRPSNTDVPENLAGIVHALEEMDDPVVFPVHPRTKGAVAKLHAGFAQPGKSSKLRLVEPVGYLDMLVLEQNARMILTDSGGVQKEAYFFGVPCVTIRSETEWVETLQDGWNVLVAPDRQAILDAVRSRRTVQGHPPAVFGDGNAAGRIVEILASGGAR